MALLSFLPEIFQGIIIMAAGIILLLHTLGFMEQGLQYLIIGGALYMIALGFIKMGGLEQIRRLTEKKK
ncbi:hypothetical protein KJZ61_00480 [Candidatus Dependentiae bacterium]|nr:hypothetical protein [Candidatus Dependentiae bacterium]